MPRISDSLKLDEQQFSAVRPQNGSTPASFREKDESKSLVALKTINMGTTVDNTASQPNYRSKVSLILPNIVEDKILAANRIDVSTRLSANLTDSDIDTLVAQFAALIQSPEFAALVRGNEQY